MNFYQRHIGDYLKDTAHLTLLEHGVYTRLLDVYYTRESGIPADQAARLIGARTRDEKAALEAVLAEFFSLEDGSFVQERCEKEISRTSKTEPDAEAAKTGKALRQQRYRERRKAIFDELRELGVTLPWDTTMDDLQDALLRASKASRVTPPETPETRNVTATNNQTPITNNHKEKDIGEGGDKLPRYVHASGDAADDPFQPRVNAIVKMLRPLGCALHGSNPHVRKWAEKGIEDVQILTAYSLAKKRRQTAEDPQPVNPGYVDSILTDVIAETNRPPAKRSQSATARLDEWNRQLSATIAAATNEQSAEIDMGYIDATGQSN